MIRSWRSLRVRLLLSYAVVLLLTLTVIALALFLLLQNRSLQYTATINSLATRLNGFLSGFEVDQLSDDAEIPALIQTALRTYAGRQNIRIVLRRADGTLTFDSALSKLRRPTEKLEFNDQPYTLSNVNGPQIESLVRGLIKTTNKVNGNEADYLYVGQAIQPGRPNHQYLVFSTLAPRAVSLDQVWGTYNADILWPLAQAGAIGLGIAFVFSLLISRSVARPLQDVADTADLIARGKRDLKAPVRGPTEVRTLAESFNQMLEQVEMAQQVQRDFLANVSHDLRTPLTSIQGYSQAIMDGVAATPQSTRHAAQIIHEEAERMYRMVQELLDLARIEAGKLSMTRQSVHIGDLTAAIGDRLAIVARNKGINLKTEIAPNLPVIGGDGDRLSQVFTNLIDNALKHTGVGGVVTLRAELGEGGLLITVHDTGEGIPEADLKRIFERFYQVDKSRQRRDGAGLGLQICYQIVQAHNGRIWAESEEGQWTRFSVWLPVTMPDGSTITRRRSGHSSGRAA